MKPFLLMAGDNYYPQGGTADWISCYETMEEAQAMVKPRPDDGFSHPPYRINNRGYDWYEIEDLRDWTDKP